MKNRLDMLTLMVLLTLSGAAVADTGNVGAIDGRKLFEQRCAACHPGGGNIRYPAKTLDKMTREANGVKSAGDIIGKMRKPGHGMTRFDKKSLSDTEAEAIADYIVKTFK